jgi:hypothetical protein
MFAITPSTPPKLLYRISVPQPTVQVSKATVDSVLNRPKPTVAQALEGYDYLKSRSSRRSAGS